MHFLAILDGSTILWEIQLQMSSNLAQTLYHTSDHPFKERKLGFHCIWKGLQELQDKDLDKAKYGKNQP